MLGPVDAARAIAELTEVSPQVREVVLVEADGSVAGSNADGDARAGRLADGGRRLLEAAEPLQGQVAQLEAATTGGSVFVVRDGDRMIVATTTPAPTVGLVFYDLKTCLRSVAPPRAGRASGGGAARKEVDAAS
jgi:predicted regulator of Ras-like GTPase activity (Roadblock/LC7/MglB family)